MNITHLQALLSVIFHSLDAYLLKVTEQIGKKRFSCHIFVPKNVSYVISFLHDLYLNEMKQYRPYDLFSLS